MRLPIYTGEASRRALVALWGLPNTAPTGRELNCYGSLAYLRTARLMFVDDERGLPIAVWEPR
jgi:hypothetical protein